MYSFFQNPLCCFGYSISNSRWDEYIDCFYIETENPDPPSRTEGEGGVDLGVIDPLKDKTEANFEKDLSRITANRWEDVKKLYTGKELKAELERLRNDLLEQTEDITDANYERTVKAMTKKTGNKDDQAKRVARARRYLEDRDNLKEEYKNFPRYLERRKEELEEDLHLRLAANIEGFGEKVVEEVAQKYYTLAHSSARANAKKFKFEVNGDKINGTSDRRVHNVRVQHRAIYHRNATSASTTTTMGTTNVGAGYNNAFSSQDSDLFSLL
jgi:hypothetical protein